MTSTKRIALIALMLMIAVSATGCRRVLLDEDRRASRGDRGEASVNDSSKIALEGATALDVTVRMGAGELKVAGGAPEGDALAAEFDYLPAAWEPRVDYDVDGAGGTLLIEQPEARFPMGTVRNSWDLQLADGVPLQLALELGAGDSDIDLTGTMLEKLELEMGAGESTIDLSGEWSNDLDARIEAGVGRLELRVPEGVGVRLIGDRQGIGEFRAEGFERDGDDLVNDAYGTAEHTFEIEISQGVGEIVVELVP